MVTELYLSNKIKLILMRKTLVQIQVLILIILKFNVLKPVFRARPDVSGEWMGGVQHTW